MANRAHTPITPDLLVSLLLPVKHVPDGEVVTKANGTTTYTVRRSFEPHTRGTSDVIFPFVLAEGTVLLMATDGTGAVVTEDTMVKITHRVEDLHEHLEEAMEESRAR